MAKIKIIPGCPLCDGLSVMFKAPCNCDETDGLVVNGQEFTFRDAHGNDLTGLGNLFSEGAVVKALLDTVNGYAYIQNADTNAYIEEKLRGAIVNPVGASRTLALADTGNFLRVDAAATITVPADIFPIGAELEVFRNTSATVAIAADSGVSFAIPGNNELSSKLVVITDQYASVVLKHISTNVWSIQGAI